MYSYGGTPEMSPSCIYMKVFPYSDLELSEKTTGNHRSFSRATNHLLLQHRHNVHWDHSLAVEALLNHRHIEALENLFAGNRC